MDLAAQLPLLLGLAWLMPLASFVAILFFGPRMGPHGRNAAWVATAAIVTSLVLSLTAFVVWLGGHPVRAVAHGSHAAQAAAAGHSEGEPTSGRAAAGEHPAEGDHQAGPGDVHS